VQFVIDGPAGVDSDDVTVGRHSSREFAPDGMVSSIVHPRLDEEGSTHALALQQVEHLFGSIGADAERGDMRAVVKREGEVADYLR
jgi:hypothetical protein